VLALDFDDALIGLLTRARAAEMLAQGNIHKKEMTKIQRDTLDRFRKQYLAALIEHGYVLQGVTEPNCSSCLPPAAQCAGRHRGSRQRDDVGSGIHDRYPKFPSSVPW
jgi:adenine-specific DNA glycosylase